MSSPRVAAAPFFIIPMPPNNSVLILIWLPLLVLVRGIQINEQRKATEEIMHVFSTKTDSFLFLYLVFYVGLFALAIVPMRRRMKFLGYF